LLHARERVFAADRRGRAGVLHVRPRDPAAGQHGFSLVPQRVYPFEPGDDLPLERVELLLGPLLAGFEGGVDGPPAVLVLAAARTRTASVSRTSAAHSRSKKLSGMVGIRMCRAPPMRAGLAVGQEYPGYSHSRRI